MTASLSVLLCVLFFHTSQCFQSSFELRGTSTIASNARGLWNNGNLGKKAYQTAKSCPSCLRSTTDNKNEVPRLTTQLGETATTVFSESTDISASVLAITNREVDTPLAETLPATTQETLPVTPEIPRFRTTSKDLLQAAAIGILSGLGISIFRIAIDGTRLLFYSPTNLVQQPFYKVLVPAMAGLLVGGLSKIKTLPPGLAATIHSVDEESKRPVRRMRIRLKQQADSFRKSLAAAITLGSGCSLGPEGPCVELGMSLARTTMDLRKQSSRSDRLGRNRLLLSCGAAAGVAAGFNAPLAGVFFALEVVRTIFQDTEDTEDNSAAMTMLSSPSRVAPIVISSVVAALVMQRVAGAHQVFLLTQYAFRNTLAELPLFALLGALSGGVAFGFKQLSKVTKDLFDGSTGPNVVRSVMKSTPNTFKPLIGGLTCGLMGLAVPQILFGGSDSINILLDNKVMPTVQLLQLLSMKAIATAVSAGSGLVGGTFAPSLFFGAMTGASFHNVVSHIFDFLSGPLGMFAGVALTDLPAYTMVGAASVLAALFRAPLTGTILLFELSMDYHVLLPLSLSAGIGSVVTDVLERKIFAQTKSKQ